MFVEIISFFPIDIKELLTILFLFIFMAASSQSFQIEGKVLDENGQEIPYANVVLLKQEDSGFVSGTTTDEQGQFLFEDIEVGNYNLRISFVGYETYETQIELSSDLNLNNITLATSVEQLGEVQLNYVKPTIQKEADRLIFSVKGSALTEGSLLDVLRNTPSVLVIDNAINVRNAQPVVYIDDRKVNLSSSEVVELLEGTTASNIQSVEVITNPSARYDADSGVVLNIKMDKNLITGYNGSVFANYTQGVFPKQTFGTSHTLKSKGVGAFVNYSYNPAKINRNNDEVVNYPSESWRTSNNRNTSRETHTISANLEFQLGEKDNLALSSNMLFLPYFNYESKTRTVLDPQPLQQGEFGSFNARNLSDDIKHNLGFNLDYTHQFEKEAKLDINGSYTNYDYRRNQQVKSDYFLPNGNPLESTSFKTRSDQDTEIITAQFDFVKNWVSGVEFSLGAKGTNIETKSAIDQVDFINGMEVPNILNSDDFDYEEMIYAGYANLSYNNEKWNLNAGVRAEQTEVTGRSASIGDETLQDYLEWFPSVGVTYAVSEKVSLYSTYRRSITRPNYSDLNPFQFFINDNTVVSGNPRLQPMFDDRITVGTTIGSNHTIEVYYSKRAGSFYEIPLQNNQTNIITYTPLNLTDTKELSFDYQGFFEPGERWSIYLLTSFFNTRDNGVFSAGAIERDLWSNYSELASRHTFLKDKSLAVNLVINYISKNLQGLQEVDGRFLTELNMTKTILKGNGILSLNVSDFFNTHDFDVRTRFLDQDSRVASDLDNRYVRVGFRYKFGNTRLNVEGTDTEIQERDRLDQ